MDRGKQAIVLVCFLLSATACGLPFGRQGFCIEDELVQKFSNDINNKLERLQIYFETEMYEEASSLLDELIAESPDEPRLTYLRAIIDYQRQDYDGASAVFVKFIEEYPEVAEPYYLLGEINLKKGNQDLARLYLGRYCELVPQDIDAHRKLNSISAESFSETLIIEDGREDPQLVKKVGFYGACVHTYQEESIKLINGNFRTWSSMGIDFTYPLDLRGKQIVLKLKGKQGGENLVLTFRDKFAKGYNPQLMVVPKEEDLTSDWKKIKVAFEDEQPKIDLSSVVHMGLEFGFSTVQNPANSTLFVKDIIIEDAHN